MTLPMSFRATIIFSIFLFWKFINAKKFQFRHKNVFKLLQGQKNGHRNFMLTSDH